MEHWQFLIQKQGDRSWHVLESPNLEILEGRYRVLARSNLPHTDVEVRVTHSSTQEVPPKRRIQKRSRRTNSEGLMAVIPFTHLKPGIWQLRCSGDLMSDILGKSWQYSINLQVLSQLADEPVVENFDPGEGVEFNVSAHPDFAFNDNLIFAAATTEPITAQSNPDTADLLTNEEEETVISNLASSILTTEPIAAQSNPDTTDLLTNEEEIVISNLASSILTTEPITAQSNPDTTDLLTNEEEETVISNLASSILTTEPITAQNNPDTADLLTNEEAIVISYLQSTAAITESITAQSSPDTADLLTDKEEEAIIDQPVSPVWLKGETTEQILQNLIDLALPVSESLLEDEKAEDSPAIQPPPPLLLTLERENYIARWGETLTINGRVEAQDKTNNLENLHPLELKIELRSPLKAEILHQVRQPLLDKLLPFTINSSINIPADCESKLILADISLFGSLANKSEVMVLASQSFTITADVTELLAITNTIKSNQLNSLDDASKSPTSAATKEPEKSIRLDLQLFNLVKTSKTTQVQPIHSFSNKALPAPTNSEVPQNESIQISKLNKSGDLRSPQLPKLPEVPMKAIATDALVTDVADSITAAQESVENKYITTPAAPINLEQLVIRHNRVSILNKTFPYLKRLKALPDNSEDAKNNLPNVFDTQESQTYEDSSQIALTTDAYEKTPDLVPDDAQLQEYSAPEVPVFEPSSELVDDSVAEVPVVPPSSQLINDSVTEVTVVPPSSQVRSSPLIRKWMQSQGYSLPESLDFQYQDDVLNYQTMTEQQVTFADSSQTPTDDLDLSLDLNFKTEIGTETNVDTHEYGETPVPESSTAEAVTDLSIGDRNFAGEEVLEEYTENSSLSVPHLNTPPWLAQEIVVDDTYSEIPVDALTSHPSQENEQAVSNLASSLSVSAAIAEPLAIPELHVPDNELIAGETVRVRVELPDVSPQVVIKLWIEDCQTRALLDGPHLLRDLLPSSSGTLEAMTQLSVPFGCLEIRIEAIALDLATQQESHKVTIVRTVIPPDLPSLQLDELLSMDI